MLGLQSKTRFLSLSTKQNRSLKQQYAESESLVECQERSQLGNSRKRLANLRGIHKEALIGTDIRSIFLKGSFCLLQKSAKKISQGLLYKKIMLLHMLITTNTESTADRRFRG
jgi:hypothetical protein